jgi:DNA-binding CsgD family transcriptional regulator
MNTINNLSGVERGRGDWVIDSEAQFSRIVLSLYEGAVEPERWAAGLSQLTGFVGGFATNFSLRARDQRRLPFSVVSDGFNKDSIRAYLEHYATLDVAAKIAARLPIGRFDPCLKHIDEEFVRSSEFYNDFLIPSGGRYMLGGKVLQEAKGWATFAVHRSLKQGPFEADQTKALNRIAPHLVQATRMLQRFLELETDRARQHAMLDHLPWAVIIVEKDAVVTALNNLAESIIRRQDGLRVIHGRIEAWRPPETIVLHRLIADAAASARGNDSGPGGSIAISRPSEGAKVAVQVMPLPDAVAGRFQAVEPCAALIITISEENRTAPSGLLRPLFNLTAAEARLAAALAEGKALAEIAEHNGVSMNTIRTQLKSVFAKTETTRQAELVSFIARLPSLRKPRA